MAKFREILKNKNFLFLWLGQITSQFGDRLNQMALIALIYARAPGSALQLAKLLSFTIIPVFVVGPVAAAYVDRLDRRRIMIVCDVLRAVLVALVAFFFLGAKNLWPIYAALFLIFSVSRFFIPAKMAIIPELVSKEKLLLANSLSSTSGMIAVVAGLGAGGLIVESVGARGGLVIDMLTYLFSGFMVFMITARARTYLRKERPIEALRDAERLFKKTLFSEIKEGWHYLIRDSNVRFIAQSFFLLGSAAGAVFVVAIVFVQRAFGSVTQDLGILAVFLGLGLFINSLIYGRLGAKLSRIRAIFIFLGASGIVLSIFAVSLAFFPSMPLAVILSFLLGMTLAPIIISSYTLIHEITKQKMCGRIFGSLEVVAHLGFLLFMFLTSFLAERVGRFQILVFVGITLAVIGWGALALKLDKRRI